MAKIFDEDKGFKQGSQLSRSNGTAFGFKATGLGAQKDTLGQKVIDMDYTDWTKGTDYQDLTKRYSDQGRAAMDDTTGMLAARTGGLASSYATQAGQQVYGDWMTKLEDAARSLYDSQRDDALENYGIASDDYDRQYNMYDTDRKFAFEQDKFDVSQSNWQQQFDYTKKLDSKEDLKEMLYYNPDMTYQDFLNAFPDSDLVSSSYEFEAIKVAVGNKREHDTQEQTDAAYDTAYSSLYAYIYSNHSYDSYEDYVEKTGSPLSRQDYETIVAQATDDRATDNENKGYTKGQLEAQATIMNYIESEQWGGLSEEEKADLISKSGMSASYWRSVPAPDGAANEAEEDDFIRYIYTGTQDEYGNYVFQYGAGGKTFSFAPGFNPYTGSRNPDIEYGTCSNGYQPNNIGGERLSKTGKTDVINGVTEDIWKLDDGTEWIWDGTVNKYRPYSDE